MFKPAFFIVKNPNRLSDFVKASFMAFAIYFANMSVSFILTGYQGDSLRSALVALGAIIFYHLFKSAPSQPPVFEISKFYTDEKGSPFLFYGLNLALLFATIGVLSVVFVITVSTGFSFTSFIVGVSLALTSSFFVGALTIFALLCGLVYIYILRRYTQKTFLLGLPFLSGIAFAAILQFIVNYYLIGINSFELFLLPLFLALFFVGFAALFKGWYSMPEFVTTSLLSGFVFYALSYSLLIYSVGWVESDISLKEVLSTLVLTGLFLITSLLASWRHGAFNKTGKP